MVSVQNSVSSLHGGLRKNWFRFSGRLLIQAFPSSRQTEMLLRQVTSPSHTPLLQEQTDKITSLNKSLLCFIVPASPAKQICLPSQHLTEIIMMYLENITATVSSHTRPIVFRLTWTDTGQRLHARCANLNLINKLMLFYGHFVPTMQTHFLWLFHPSVLARLITLWRFANPVLFVGKTRMSQPQVYVALKGVLYSMEGKCRSSRQSLWGTNLLWLQ